MKGLTKHFGGTQALASVDFDVAAAEIRALLGENGAGKSTLIKILAGIHVADSGSIQGPRGPAIPRRPVPGVAFVHQDLGLVETMTVAENIAIGTDYARAGGMIDWRKTGERAARALDVMNCAVEPSTLVGRLSAAEKSMVAIARALAIEAEVIVLDEPTAMLPGADVARLHDVLRHLRERGLGIVYVTHRLDEVFRLADRVTVLRDGKLRSTRSVAETTPTALVEDIVGRRVNELFPAIRRNSGDVVLTVSGLRSKHAGPVSFTVAQGEVVGLVGLRNAGHDVVGRMLAGDVRALGGTIMIEGKEAEFLSPAAAIERGIGFVSSKRVEESLCNGLAVRENLYVDPALAGLRLIGTPTEKRSAWAALGKFDVRPRKTESPIATLSGGNQQKVVIARWLSIGRRLLVLEEPTTGVDVGAKAEIYQLLDEALGRGLAVVLVSSDFEEIAGVCDRAFVFSRGRQIAELPGSELSIARITHLAAGGSG
ncbi:MAG: sugar ABC transporter ATP-binding protein [Bauldia sp.]|nr:sugar ABC transporter ATP-binding protein [Bauldia sp.]